MWEIGLQGFFCVNYLPFHFSFLGHSSSLPFKVKEHGLNFCILYGYLLHNEYLLLTKHVLILHQSRSKKTDFMMGLDFFIRAA